MYGTKPNVASKLAEASHPGACPLQLLPVLLTTRPRHRRPARRAVAQPAVSLATATLAAAALAPWACCDLSPTLYNTLRATSALSA
eukprot:scaffold15840_cov42-Phaeocystis_antarctica.AAC.1